MHGVWSTVKTLSIDARAIRSDEWSVSRLFQRIIDTVIQKHGPRRTYAYLDNVTACVATVEEHDKNLAAFPKASLEENLALNEKTTVKRATEIDQLGYRLSFGSKTIKHRGFTPTVIGWTWTELWNFKTGSGSQNMTVHSSLQWCTGSGFWIPIRRILSLFLELDIVSLSTTSGSDYPNEMKCGHAKNLDVEY